MIPIVLAGVMTTGMAVFVVYGLTRVFRQRKINMVDYPELPPPASPGEDKPGPARQA